MVHWTKVISGFDAEDETVNFGGRTVAEQDGSIYETWTRATLQCDNPGGLQNDQQIPNPDVKAAFCHSYLCIAVDNSLTIFADESCQEIIMSIGFESPVTAYCLSQTGSLLFAAVEDGPLHCFRMSESDCESSRSCIDLDEFDCRRVIYLSLEDDSNGSLKKSREGSMTLTIVSADGKILKLPDVDKSENGVTNISKIKLVHTSSNICWATEIPTHISKKTIITLGEKISLYPTMISRSLKQATCHYKKAQFFSNYAAAICLGSDDSLSIVCKMTLQSRKVYPGPVQDFVTIADKTLDYHMLVLMKPKEEDSTADLHLMSFPDFHIKFSMAVSKNSFLVDLNSVDHLIFLESVKNSQNLIDTIRIKAIEESSPEFRLQRLLRRQTFDEARKFAKRFDLNEEVVYHAEARMLMERLQPSIHAQDFVDVDVFLKTLQKIQDVQFVYDCCMNAMTRDYTETRILMEYAKKRIVDFMNCHDKTYEGYDILVELLTLVSDNLRKLETFEGIHEEFTTNIEEWTRFSKVNLLDECIKHLSVGELNAAALIWIRHAGSISGDLSTTTISRILESIPKALTPAELWPWLRHFIPSATALIPTCLPDILTWALDKTRSLEIYHRESWPGIGLDFANVLTSMLQFEENNIFCQFHQQYATKDSNLQQLQQIIQAMSDILDLKTKYQILIPLATYTGDPTEVVHLLLHRVHVNEIPSLMTNFLQEYMLNHCLKTDVVLSSYIHKILRNSKSWWITDKAPWDRRLAAIIGQLHNVQNRLQQTLEILKKAPVPWSQSVNALASESYKYSHPLVAQIRVEANSVNVKLIMKKYGFADVGLCNNLYNRIIKEDRETVIDDLLELTKNASNVKLQILSRCILHHVRAGQLDRLMKMMDQFDDAAADYCCKQIVSELYGRMNLFGDTSLSLQYYVDILGYVTRKLSEGSKDTLALIPILRNVYTLKTQFNMSISVRDYLGDRRQILLQFISDLGEGFAGSSDDNIALLEQVSRLLDLPRLSGIVDYFESTKDIEVLKSFVINYLSTWEVLTPEECHYSLKICDECINQVEDNQLLAKSLKTLISQILVYAPSKLLPDALRCYSKIEALNEAVSQTSQHQDSIYPIYRDASISAGEVLVPYLNELSSICSFYEHTGSDAGIDQIANLRRALPIKTKSLMNENCDFAVWKILMSSFVRATTLLPEHETVVTEFRGVLNTCNSIMLKKVINSNIFDMHLGLACLFTLPQEKALKLLTLSGQMYECDQRRDGYIKDLSCEYFRLTKNYPEMSKFKLLKLLNFWAKRLSSCGIHSREIITSSIEDRRNILKRIMTSKRPETLEILRGFCSDFGFIFTDCCLKYLEILLTTWRPEFTVTTCQGPRRVKIDENQVKQLIKECQLVSAEIVDKVTMKKCLTEALKIPLFNFYNYEVFLIALDLAELNNDMKWRSHLCFLQNYTRIANPTESETDTWLNLFQEPQLPPISQFRLPFLPGADFFKLFTQELHLQTYQQWLSIAPTLNISISNICTLSVKNSTDEAWRSSKGLSTAWSINSRNSTLLKEIKKCLEHMDEVDRLKYGTASLYYVVNHTPPGADLVAAAKECFLYMEKLKELCGDEADTANKFSKIMEKYVVNTRKHILHSHGLGLPKYLDLVDHHKELIIELYKDESIPERYRIPTNYRPDINAATAALEEVVPVNLAQIRGDLLEEWLLSDTSETNNDSITAVFREDTSDCDGFATDDNLLRACYVVSSGNTEEFIHYLAHISFDGTENYNPQVRFRAMRVIESLIDADTLESYTKISSERFQGHIKSLRYLTELQKVGIAYSVDGFEACSKVKLVQVLVNSHCAARALYLIPQIFLDFDLDDFDVLDSALAKMEKLRLIKQLKRSLMMLAGVDRLANHPGYISAWRLVVSEGFASLEAGVNEQNLESCIETLRMLHTCPIIDKLEIEKFVGACLVKGHMQLPGVLLQFLKVDERQRVLQTIVSHVDVDWIVGELRELEKKGILGVGQSIGLMEKAKALPGTNLMRK